MTIGRLSSAAARKSADHPCSDSASNFCRPPPSGSGSSNKSTRSSHLPKAAKCISCRPPRAGANGSAFAVSNAFTTGPCPPMTASCRGVCSARVGLPPPTGRIPSTGEPASKSSSQSDNLPRYAAQCNAVRPFSSHTLSEARARSSRSAIRHAAGSVAEMAASRKASSIAERASLERCRAIAARFHTPRVATLSGGMSSPARLLREQRAIHHHDFVATPMRLIVVVYRGDCLRRRI